MESARDRLLAAAIDHLAARGLGDLSLRQLAEALGTSHRMLLYHFGSKEGLLVEVVRAVEAGQRDLLAGLPADLPPAELARQVWNRVAAPDLWPHERLFFELYGRALAGDPKVAPVLDGIVESWIGPGTQLGMLHGLPEAEARAQARLGLAVVRGLLLDLLATGDRAGVDAAMDRFLATCP
ncbi:TetR/AcrR family transcriptional regulator [Longispora sp. K20-0274]|uniref:TetR/AcrR family transcriptional regulator n=1 Tax=Longispora sp. K20-0274 TaxID=3088255 RepID=UPI00399A7CCB